MNSIDVDRFRSTLLAFWLVVVALAVAARAAAQSTTPVVLTLKAAVEMALQNFPAIRAAQAQVDAAGGGIDLARTAYLPRTELLWQENRATRNNVFGMLLPQSVVPSISGPVLGTRAYDSTWGSAVGALFTWEAFDFGFRKASVGLAQNVRDQSVAGAELTQLEVGSTAADAFLSVVAAGHTVRAAQANLERMQVFAESVKALVNSELRPGADLSRAEAELAAARIQHIQAQQILQSARITLSEAMGMAGSALDVTAGQLLELPRETPAATPGLKPHPMLLWQNAVVDAVRNKERMLERSYFPRFSLQSAFFSRGSGALTNGRFNDSRGLLPDVPNWAAGVSITFPVFDIFGIRARRKVEASNAVAEKARYEQTVQRLQSQEARARTHLDAARRIAENTPVQLKAARDAEQRAGARYKAGLAAITEVSDTQRLLTQSEIDDALARLSIWRALLAVAKARGDLSPFLQQLQETNH